MGLPDQILNEYLAELFLKGLEDFALSPGTLTSTIVSIFVAVRVLLPVPRHCGLILFSWMADEAQCSRGC